MFISNSFLSPSFFSKVNTNFVLIKPFSFAFTSSISATNPFSSFTSPFLHSFGSFFDIPNGLRIPQGIIFV